MDSTPEKLESSEGHSHSVSMDCASLRFLTILMKIGSEGGALMVMVGSEFSCFPVSFESISRPCVKVFRMGWYVYKLVCFLADFRPLKSESVGEEWWTYKERKEFLVRDLPFEEMHKLKGRGCEIRTT